MHHKFAIIDGETIIAGSHNWSASANNNTDETVLAISNPTVAAHFVREFDRLYQGATLGIPAKLADKIEQRQAKCPPPQPKDKTGADSGRSENQRVNLNTATQEELETLPGVGPVLAGRMIAARANKPFTSLADLDRVPGIGPKMLEKLGDRVTF